MPRNKEKLIITLYTVLGILLALTGLYIIWVTNTGTLLVGETYVRYGVFALGIFLLIIGSHLTIVGVSSLKSS